MKALLITLFFITWLGGFAQDMKDGFVHLETGEFSNAEYFFQNVIQEYPDNRTARLCYARAVGLNGRPEEAKLMLSSLLKQYPNDFELELNYAESLLWNKNYNVAKEYYTNLLNDHKDDFAVLIGYANTLSNLREYDAALNYIEMAIAREPGNVNASKSRMYIRLGKSAELRDALQYEQALELLRLNLAEAPHHMDTMLSMASIYLLTNNWDAANSVYASLPDPVTSLMGRSLVAHKKRKNKIAKSLAEEAKRLAEKNGDKAIQLRADERYVQALLWNSQYGKARKAIDSLWDEYGNQPIVIGLRASYGMYSGRFSYSEAQYRQLLDLDSTSFDGNLGMANVQKALGNPEAARRYAKKTLHFFPNQKDALALLKNIDRSMAPASDTYSYYSADNGNNEAVGFTSRMEIPLTTGTRAAVNFGYRLTENMTSNQVATNTDFGLELKQRLKGNTWINGAIGLLKANTPDNSYSDVIGSVMLSSPLLPKQNLSFGYSRNLQNFNAALIDKKIFMNNYLFNHNLGTSFGLGWYTAFTYTSQTDGNRRDLWFTSLYQNITNQPEFLLKGGINYQLMGFDVQVPELYFSPSSYQAAELFLDLRGSSEKWSYAINAAGGFQYIEDQEAATAFRFEGSGGIRFNSKFQLNLVGKYSNIASETASGFNYTEFGLRLKWQVGNGSLFKPN